MVLVRTFITTPIYCYFLNMHDCMNSITGGMSDITSSIVIIKSSLKKKYFFSVKVQYFPEKKIHYRLWLHKVG